MRGFVCRGCKNHFLRDGLCTTCTTCAAQKLYDATVESQAAEIERQRAENERLREAMTDMLSGWRYIRETYGDLAGIGWDRVEQKARETLEAKP